MHFVINYRGNEERVTLPSDFTVHDVTEHLADKFDVDVHSIKLIFKGQNLLATSSPEALKTVPSGSSLMLVGSR
jgi:hypothetical protein